MAQQFVENVLSVHKKYLDMIKEVFQGDQAFIGALDKACNAVINHRQPKQPSKAPELVSSLSVFNDLLHTPNSYVVMTSIPSTHILILNSLLDIVTRY